MGITLAHSDPTSASGLDISPTGLPALDNTYGATLIGTFLGLILYGLTLHQVCRYCQLYPDDAKWIKRMVLGMAILDTIHSVLCVVFMYYHLVTSHGNTASLLANHWTTTIIMPITGVTMVLCQSFYAVRVFRIERRFIYRLLVGASAISMIATLGFTVASTLEASQGSLYVFEQVSWLIGAMFGFAMLTDVCLAGTLVVVLLRSRTGFKTRTDSLIETLIIYTINTGLLTTLVGLPCFIFTLILPGNLVYAGIAIVGVKLYPSSVLAVLNSRQSLADRMTAGVADLASFEPNNIRSAGRDARLSTLQAAQAPPRLSISCVIVSQDGAIEMATMNVRPKDCTQEGTGLA